MKATTRAPSPPEVAGPAPALIPTASLPDRTFEAVVFEWDGTAVPDRNADAGEVRARIEALCATGTEIVVVSGTHVGNIDGQLGARSVGPGRLHLCLNRGSEVFRVDREGPHLVYRRTASPEEDAALDRAAALTVERLRARGLRAEIVSQRLNRRKIDLIPDARTALAKLRDLEAIGFDRLLAGHRAEWAARWRDADVTIEGDDDAQRAVRFALFHLMASSAGDGEAAVGARGLSGPAYGGRVFWDAEVFVLAFLAATHPASARAMVEYRIRRLPAARREAKKRRNEGAHFPWESADDGTEVAPRFVRPPDGRIVPIRTGEHVEHVTADIAWAAWHYVQWTGDEAFLRGPGRMLLTETARYWASWVRFDRAGRAHLYGVTGPDEYHEIVDDNAYTNVMVRWNLGRAADLVERDGIGATRDEASRWRRIAAALTDGYDTATGVYEQFAGFRRLEPVVISELAARPVAADVLLGRERVARAQVIKQADVLMLHHLAPGEVTRGSFEPNLDFYEPRTAHGSSLSPGIHAALLARAGRTERALELFRIACRLDLDDLTGTTAAGLHLAAMGGVWQALACGFAGVRPGGRALTLDPRLPETWDALGLRLRFRGRRVGLRIERDRIDIECDSSVRFMLPGGRRVTVRPPGLRLAYEGEGWRGE
ncbi:MAG: glycosyl hydrolase family 65 protein [Actinomycetota bacterium]